MKNNGSKKIEITKKQASAAEPAASPHRSRRGILAAIAAVACLTVGAILVFNSQCGHAAAPVVSNLKLEDIPFDGAKAYEYLKQLCDFGPRPSGSAAMETQQKFLVDYFQKLGATVEFQRFRAKHPIYGSWVPMANILVHWNPECERRVMLCAHYDTLPFPLRDPENARGRFIGANDNASGVAILMELGNEMSKFKNKIGVDFVLLDGEEFVFGERDDPMFLGAEYFAREYIQNHPKPGYRWAILLDMVGDADLQILQERESMRWRDTQPLVKELWATAARLGVHEFVARPMRQQYFMDDHVVLHNLGHIPGIDVIDFEYPHIPRNGEVENRYWHTQQDTPDKCSALSLAKVGWVISEWLKNQ